MTRSSHPTRRHPGKPEGWWAANRVWLTLGALVVWAVAISVGLYLPYLRTEFSFNLRLFIFFSLLGLMAYFIFVHRMPGQKISAYAMRLVHLKTASERIKENVGMLLGALLICGTIAWTSIVFPALATQLFAFKHQELIYQVEKIAPRSGTMLDLTLVDPASGETVGLHLNRSRFRQWRWKPGDYICLTGRAWIFGTIIEREVRCAAPMHPSLNP